jgi:hypothetical protein
MGNYVAVERCGGAVSAKGEAGWKRSSHSVKYNVLWE